MSVVSDTKAQSSTDYCGVLCSSVERFLSLLHPRDVLEIVPHKNIPTAFRFPQSCTTVQYNTVQYGTQFSTSSGNYADVAHDVNSGTL